MMMMIIHLCHIFYLILFVKVNLSKFCRHVHTATTDVINTTKTTAITKATTTTTKFKK